MFQKFNFTKLDERTRGLMVDEISIARTSSEIYYSNRFTPTADQAWPIWLLDSAREHDEHWLAYQLDKNGAMRETEIRNIPLGGFTLAYIPGLAAETLADGQFNRFYIAAICRRAMEDGKTSVNVYRAKHRDEPRSESLALEGNTKVASNLLLQVRSKNESLTCNLLRPNSGLSVDY